MSHVVSLTVPLFFHVVDDAIFADFRYEPDYVPQCVELSDEYIEEINRGGVGTESLLEQLEDRNDEDYSEYLEVLEETNADPIAILPHNTIEIIDNSQQHLTTDMINSYDNQNVSNGVNIYTQIQSKYLQAQSVETTSTELFFNSMAQTVKLLPPKAQAEVKMAVCKIVTEAELRCSKKKLSANTQQFITPP
ncbi:hypothetical protein G9C98_006919, partial [Cotesia typhae]